MAGYCSDRFGNDVDVELEVELHGVQSGTERCLWVKNLLLDLGLDQAWDPGGV